jgi:hypothetical protein
MAQGLAEFAEYLKSARPRLGPFKREPYYEPETDSLIYYVRDEPSYSERRNKYLTLFLSSADKSLVGVEVKGIKTIMRAVEDLGPVPVDSVRVTDEHGDEVDLSVIVRCSLVHEPVEADEFGRLNDATRGVRIRSSLLCTADG